MDIPKYRDWSVSAIECYRIGGTCSKCDIMPEDMKKKCKLRFVIVDLVRRLGAPVVKEDYEMIYYMDKYKLRITQTELDVLKLLIYPNKEIGEKLFISPKTVGTHLADLFEKLNAHNKTELLYKALKYEIIDLREIDA